VEELASFQLTVRPVGWLGVPEAHWNPPTDRSLLNSLRDDRV
jgi:hypothetical protein